VKGLAAGLAWLLAGCAAQLLPVSAEEKEAVRITVVYDNNPYDARLATAWGFACLVQTRTATVLFDTGGDGSILLGNLEILGLDPLRIDAVVLSHAHGDHTGGLAALLDTGVRPTVYLPAAFPSSFKNGVRRLTKLVEVSGPLEILPGIHVSGCVGTGIVEQALVVETGEGLLVVTGCAHPGIDTMVWRCRRILDGPVALLVGGFHLGAASAPRIASLIEELLRLEVRSVAPCHCTGDLARSMFQQAFGPAYAAAGAGWERRLAPYLRKASM
jgi:7,8-dihydropterin-6-yl-methyl-4-(beta-D-ribofuranosyl)aminobenzene 5'-phosphate synthase